jgi:hypothetical protein
VDKAGSEHAARSPFIGGHEPQNTLRIWQFFCRAGSGGVRHRPSTSSHKLAYARVQHHAIPSFPRKAGVRTTDFFRERARRADLPGTFALLHRLGRDEPPRSGDELDRAQRKPARGQACRRDRAPAGPGVRGGGCPGQACSIGYLAKIASQRLNALSIAASGVTPLLMTSLIALAKTCSVLTSALAGL